MFLRKSFEIVKKSMNINGLEVDLNPAANRRKTKLLTKKLSAIHSRANSLNNNKGRLVGSIFSLNRRSKKYGTTKMLKNLNK